MLLYILSENFIVLNYNPNLTIYRFIVFSHLLPKQFSNNKFNNRYDKDIDKI